MIILRNIQVGNYILEVAVTSKSVEGHSLISDNKDSLEIKVEELQRYIRGLISHHIQTKG